MLLKPGFAPPEQYSKKGNQNTWTDVYALAATLYYIVSGKVPQDSLSRMQADQLQPLDQMGLPISASMAQAVGHALEIDYANVLKLVRNLLMNWSVAVGRSGQFRSHRQILLPCRPV